MQTDSRASFDSSSSFEDGAWACTDPGTEEADDFPEVPLELLDGSRWSPVISRPWKVTGAEEELRALLCGIEALVSESSESSSFLTWIVILSLAR